MVFTDTNLWESLNGFKPDLDSLCFKMSHDLNNGAKLDLYSEIAEVFLNDFRDVASSMGLSARISLALKKLGRSNSSDLMSTVRETELVILIILLLWPVGFNKSQVMYMFNNMSTENRELKTVKVAKEIITSSIYDKNNLTPGALFNISALRMLFPKLSWVAHQNFLTMISYKPIKTLLKSRIFPALAVSGISSNDWDTFTSELLCSEEGRKIVGRTLNKNLAIWFTASFVCEEPRVCSKDMKTVFPPSGTSYNVYWKEAEIRYCISLESNSLDWNDEVSDVFSVNSGTSSNLSYQMVNTPELAQWWADMTEEEKEAFAEVHFTKFD